MKRNHKHGINTGHTVPRGSFAYWYQDSIIQINKVTLVTLLQTQSVLKWATVHGNTSMVCNKPLRPTQLPILSGIKGEYWPRISHSDLWLWT